MRFILPLFGLVLAQAAVIDHPVRVQDLFAPLQRRALPQLHGFFDGSTLDKIQSGFRDMAKMGRAILEVFEEDEDTWNRVLNVYFDTEAGCDEVSENVYDMFESMAVADGKGAGEYGSEKVGGIILDAEDFNNWDGKVNGYVTVKDEKHARMHISPRGFQNPSLADVDCDNLGDTVSNQMVTFAGVVLIHEITHAPEIARKVMKNSRCQYGGTEDLPAPDDIKTLWQRDEKPLAVGPIYTRALRQSPSQRGKAICNADNWAWFATELYWTHKCGRAFKRPTSNDYAPPKGYSS